MKIHEHWQRNVEAWRESGLSQADYCRQQVLNPKTFSTWTRPELPIDQDLPLEVIPVQAAPSAPVAATEASVIMLGLRSVLSLNCPQRCRAASLAVGVAAMPGLIAA